MLCFRNPMAISKSMIHLKNVAMKQTFSTICNSVDPRIVHNFTCLFVFSFLLLDWSCCIWTAEGTVFQFCNASVAVRFNNASNESWYPKQIITIQLHTIMLSKVTYLYQCKIAKTMSLLPWMH